MKESALARLFYRELEKVETGTSGPLQKAEDCFRLLNLLFVEVTQSERLQFSSAFSRIAYASQKAGLSKSLQYYIHAFRKQMTQSAVLDLPAEEAGRLQVLGSKVLLEATAQLLNAAPPAELTTIQHAPWPYEAERVDLQAFRKSCRVVALRHHAQAKQLVVKDEAHPEEQVLVQYDIADRNAHFNPTIRSIVEIFHFPVLLHLIDVEIDNNRVYRPRAIVVEPDYLVDVSAIAECFKPTGTVPELFLLKKFLPFEVSRPLILGNIANFFLDEIMRVPEASYREIFAKVFRLYPLAFALLDNREVRTIMQLAQKHYVNLRKVVERDLPDEKISKDSCYLEPSFYAPEFGLQGRLDVLALGDRNAIIELKSGKVYQPNRYGISVNHYTQTLLYDLIIQAVFTDRANPANYILYSGVDDRHLRYAPVVRTQQFEALQVRNLMLALECRLQRLGSNSYFGHQNLLELGGQLFGSFALEKHPAAHGFVKRDLNRITDFYQQLSDLEKRYFLAFSGFISREHRFAKTGAEDSRTVNGQATLWLDGFKEKEEQYKVLAHLELQSSKASEEEPLLYFKRSAQTNPLANFREGDIIVLYPYFGKEAGTVHHQIFKGTIVEINAEMVVVRLRAAQFNDQLFQDKKYWNLEHDLLDSGFIGMYRNLFAFGQSTPHKKKLILGLVPPARPEKTEVAIPGELTLEQQAIFAQLIQSKDYFLLWGPPGTGKTSIMLKHYTGFLYRHTDEQILLLAYTNRAVDEICAAIEQFDPAMKTAYLRIGSRYSTAEAYRDRLLSVQIGAVSNRKELISLIQQHRIIVGTVASISGKPELFTLKNFDRVIIDEASQILEPMLVGLLPHFSHFTLIGDHKQLPAVVVQDAEMSAIDDPGLNGIGLFNLRNSLFERLYKRAQAEGWHWAYAQLSQQGRMHADIMDFPNRFFYEGRLQILPATISHHQKQIQPMELSVSKTEHALIQRLCRQRLLFLPTPVDSEGLTQKTNKFEAVQLAELLVHFEQLYTAAGKAFHLGKVGIITPFRAQIAMIKKTLEERQFAVDTITIDTVERYQGGARDIILISLCTNSMYQLSAMTSHSEEGVDRKLNVALTRAREHLVIIGNPEVLQADPVYRQLLEYCGVELPAGR